MIPHRSFPTLAAVFVALSITVAGWNPAALAQIPGAATSTDTAVEIPEEFTKEQVGDLVARLSDEEARDLLIRQLDKVAVADAQAETKDAIIDRFISVMRFTGLPRHKFADKCFVIVSFLNV